MVLKRVIAYFIDILVVTFASSMLASISYINPQLEKYNKVYDEYIKFYDNYQENMENIKTGEIISKYKSELDDINYRLNRYNIYGAAISIFMTVIYFAVFQKYNNGQTLGKRIMHIKVNWDLNLFKYLLRTLILHNVWINVLRLLLIITISKSRYILASDILYIVALVIEVTNIIMICMRQDNRGIHDIITGSNVVETRKIIKS